VLQRLLKPSTAHEELIICGGIGRNRDVSARFHWAVKNTWWCIWSSAECGCGLTFDIKKFPKQRNILPPINGYYPEWDVSLASKKFDLIFRIQVFSQGDMKMKLTKLALACALTSALAACGGGGSDSSSDSASITPPGTTTAAASTKISGTAASGAPIIGKVTVKDSLGAQKTVDIEADGSYTVDVAGMTGPFMFRAAGNVGGRDVSLVSIATAADFGKTINITPFTDLIVANIAGKAAAKFFDAPDFSKLSATEIDAARNQLTARLQPILTALGVNAGFDLLRSAFKADHTAFDAVMDVVKVSVDPETNKATIKELVNNTQIEDDLSKKDDNTPLPAPVAPLAGTVTDLVAINHVLDTITALFATSVPAADNADLRNAFTADYLDNGSTLTEFLSPNGLLSVENIGVKLLSAVILSRDGDSKIWITLSGTETNGKAFHDKVLFKKGTDGVWRMAGNRRLADIHVQAVNSHWMNNTQNVFERNLDFWVGSNASNTIQYVTIAGPGLKTPLGLIRSTTVSGSNFNVDGGQNQGSWVRDCASQGAVDPCVDFTQVTNDAVYTVTYYDNKVNVNPLGTDTLLLPRPPVSNADAQANVNAWFATPALDKFLPLFYNTLADGNGITIAWTNPTDSAYHVDNVGFNTQNINFHQDLIGTETSKLVGNWSGAAPTATNNSSPNFWINTKGPFNREFVTNAPYPGSNASN
jgi:hypothetical protein